MGDVLPTAPLPAGVDAAKVKQAIDAAFEPADGAHVGVRRHATKVG